MKFLMFTQSELAEFVLTELKGYGVAVTDKNALIARINDCTDAYSPDASPFRRSELKPSDVFKWLREEDLPQELRDIIAKDESAYILAMTMFGKDVATTLSVQFAQAEQERDELETVINAWMEPWEKHYSLLVRLLHLIQQLDYAEKDRAMFKAKLDELSQQ